MGGSWIESAQSWLLQSQSGNGGWGYRPGCQPSLEPTVLACLGLLASDSRPSAEFTGVARRGADWLAANQRRDGSLGVSPQLQRPCWGTPYAILFWAALGGYATARKQARQWLLAQRGHTFPKALDDPVGHDTTIAGWPWVTDTHSWLEPTALAVLALRREGLGDHVRTQEGLMLIRDRAIASGGWNYGNNVVFGRELRPGPAPTGLALLAMALPAQDPTVTIASACKYLETALPTIRSAVSLSWGLLGLSAWGRRPAGADDWLAQAYENSRQRPDALQLSCLLLAAGPRRLEVLGIASGHDASAARGDRSVRNRA